MHKAGTNRSLNTMRFALLDNFNRYNRVLVNIPMHTPSRYSRCLYQSLGPNQALVDYRPHAARIHHRLVNTPLDPYGNAVCLS
uniref:Uncharacterized protein n=1 Tax=Anguilla anguilla TaxID=7936 RepID=A0A0E9RG94_ANGAN